MPIKTILVGTSGGAANDGAAELACHLAARFGAHLEAMHVRLDVAELMIAAVGAGGMMPLDNGWIQHVSDAAVSTASRIKTGFTEAATRNGLPTVEFATPGKAGVSWYEESGDAPLLLARRARFFDLVVLGRSERVVAQPHTDAIEQTLIRSGRPVLLAPSTPPTALGVAIALGWNGSAEAVRAVIAALPFLMAAKTVAVLAIGDRVDDSAETLKRYLAMHGVEAKVRRLLMVAGVNAGDQLLSAAHEEGADLLVMGAYGHAPWRETLFGGATRAVIGAALLPLLIAH